MELRKEKSFPRGGKKPAFLKSSNNSNLSFFRTSNKKVKKKSQKAGQSVKKNKTEKSFAKQPEKKFKVKFVEDLKPTVIQDGMLILGIVSKLTENIVIVSLPGGLRGAITPANVSEFYKNLVEKSSGASEIPNLAEIFVVGDVLPVKVLSASEKHHSLMLTSDPKAVNEKLSYNLIENGFILTGSIKSQEDHGLIIDFGIEHLNGFLNYEKVNESQKLKVGQLIRCCVIECNAAPGSCNVQLSILKKDLQSSFIKTKSTLPVDCFIPGFQYKVTVTQILNEGLEVSYGQGDSAKGYIYEDYLLKKFSNSSDIAIKSKFIATLLYVKPLVKFLYFKIMPAKELEWPFKFGEIVSGKVVKVRRAGVLFKISEGTRKAKCFVPLSKLRRKVDLQDKSEILNSYPINKKVPKIRLGNVDLMKRYYVGATDRTSLMEKYYSISDIKCGEIISCKIVAFGKSSARLEIGRSIRGFVAFSDMTDVPLRNPSTKFKLGQKVKCRVVDVIPEKLCVRLTMKPTLMKEKEILCDINMCKKNSRYVGTIFKIMSKKIIVKFFNFIFGTIPQNLTPYPGAKNLKDHFYEGQLVKCNIIGVQGKSLHLSLLTPGTEMLVEVGKKYKVTVVNKTDTGLFLNVIVNKNTTCRGFLPSTLLSIHQSLVTALYATYSPGEKLTAYCVANDTSTETPLFGAKEVFEQFYEGKTEEDFKKLLTEDTILPFLFRNKGIKTNQIFLKSLIPGKNDCSVMVVRNDFLEACPLVKYQLILGKILNVKEKKLEVSIKLSDVWDKDFNVIRSSLEFLNSYLKAMTFLVLRQKNKLNVYSKSINLNCFVKGVIEEVKAKHAIMRTEDGDLGIVEGVFEKGQNVTGKIIWIDGPEQLFYVQFERNHSVYQNNGKLSVVRENDNLRGKVVFINQEVIVLKLKGRGNGELGFSPRRRHLNDILNNECVIAVGEELKFRIVRKDFLLAIDHRIVAMQEKVIWKKSEEKLKKSVQTLKRKLESEKIERLKKRKTDSELDDVQVVNIKLNNKPKKGVVNELPEVKKEKVDDVVFTNTEPHTPRLEFDDVDIKSEVDDNENEKQELIFSTQNEERIELSSSSESDDETENSNKNQKSKAFEVGFNWDVLNNLSLLSGVMLKKDELSSEDEDNESKYDKKKQRRLTALEKKEKAKSEEERLRFIEERLMNTEREPESVEDFDRAILAEPNSSVLWLKYMAFHIQETEIEKARAVARRALKAISFREEQEKLNIWIALLNLENMYGSEDSVSRTLGEALQVNEPYKIHLHLLNMYGQGNKFQEMEKLGNFMLKKYKDMENMWYDVSSAYFSAGKVESARNVLQRALTVLDKNQHVSLISKFAQMENKHGSPERGQTLYESILASFPKRVDIWCCYVDMLVKSNYIDLARQVLERATSQSLRPRKMKTLFKKFLAFEEVYGTPENVAKVQEAAVEYVQTVGFVEDNFFK